MELPITVMIVLFVSLVVGGIIIVFSNTMLQNAENTMPKIEGDTLQDKIVDVDSVTEGMLTSFAAQCVEDNRQSLDEELCVILNSQTAVDTGGFSLPGYVNDQTQSGRHTIYVYYYGNHNEVVLKS